MKMEHRRILTFLMMALLCHPAFGQGRPSEDFNLARKSPYSLDLTKDLAIFGVGNAMLGLGILLSQDIDPLSEEEIALLDPMDVNRFDRVTIAPKRDIPAGDLLLLGSLFLPLTFLTHDETKKDMGRLAVMAGEVFVCQLGLNFVLKGLAERPRPYTYDANTSMDVKTTTSAKLSFYSGHTSTAASMSFFVAKVFSDYLSSKGTKAMIWTAAAVYPALIGFLRIDSGNHFRTDALVGYLAGALIGYLIPVLHKSELKNNLSIHSMVLNNHVALGVSYRF